MSIRLSDCDDDLSIYKKLKDNFNWFYTNYEKLRKNFSNQYVAVKDRKHIDNDYDLERLLKRLKLQTLEDSIVIEYVNR